MIVVFFWARRRVEDFWARVRLGFAILGDRRRFTLGVLVPQAISWVFRLATLYFFLKAFGVHASMHNALLAQVVDSLSTLFPATPGGAGTKQGLIVYLFRRSAVSTSLLLAFSVGMNIAITIENLMHRARGDRADGAHAVVQAPAPARPTRAGGVVPFASVYPLVTARAVAREFTYEVDETVRVGAIVRVPFGRSRARGIVDCDRRRAARRASTRARSRR